MESLIVLAFYLIWGLAPSHEKNTFQRALLIQIIWTYYFSFVHDIEKTLMAILLLRKLRYIIYICINYLRLTQIVVFLLQLNTNIIRCKWYQILEKIYCENYPRLFHYIEIIISLIFTLIDKFQKIRTILCISVIHFWMIACLGYHLNGLNTPL